MKEYGNHIIFSYYSLNSKKIWKSKTDMTLKDEQPRSVCVQYATRKEQRNRSRRNEEAEQKCKWYPVVDVSGGENKVWCYKEQYCIGTWNVRSMNQDKLEKTRQQSEHQHIMNQLTKMNENGQI